jgi:chaperone LolA
MKTDRTLYLLALLLLLWPSTGEAQQSHQRQLVSIMSQLRTNWQDLDGLSARFTHTFEWVLAGETQVTEGDIYLAGRNRFRIEFDGRVMVSDGTTLWDYDPKQNQVLLYRVDASRNITTQEQLFAAYTENVDAEWIREEMKGETRIVVIRLLRGEDADPQRVDVWIDTGRMLATRAEYTDGAGNDHIYLLRDIEVGEQPADKFKFDIPEGVIVVDLRPGSGR